MTPRRAHPGRVDGSVCADQASRSMSTSFGLLLAVGGSLVLVCEKAGDCCACQNIVDVTAPPCSRKTNDQADGYRRQNFSHGVTDPYVKFPEQIV